MMNIFALPGMMCGIILAISLPSVAAAQTIPQPATLPAKPAEGWVRFDTNGQTAWGVSGVANRTTNRLATIHDPVRVASISKLVVALGVMRLVEQGKLDLDRDVSDYLDWNLRNPAYPDTKITLAMLLSHTSSLNDNGEGYLVPLGATLEQAMADPAMWDKTHMPGAYFTYGNINFGIVGQIIERATRTRFDHAMDALVMEPLQLSACYNWGGGCTNAYVARAITLYRPNGNVARDDLGGKLEACPVFVKEGASCDLSTYPLGTNGALFSPQGGLRIAPSELAEIGRMLARSGIAADGSRFLNAQSIATMKRPRWIYDGNNGAIDGGFYCAYGLATQILGMSDHPDCRDRLPGLPPGTFGHAGDAYSLKSGLWVNPQTKSGIAYYAIAVADTTPETGPSAYTITEQKMAAKGL